MSDRFDQQLNQLEIELTEKQKVQFHRYYEMLVEWNKVMNLTGITEYDEVNEKHFIDSLSVKKVVDMDQVDSLIDIGTGAGFPGIPLKIAYPHLKVVLLDSLQKRIKFLDAVIEELELNEIETLHGRAFPGIPLKIAYPHLKVVLLDSLQKRIKFLDAVIEELELNEIETLHGRAEDYAKKAEYREQFDLCVSRAVANLSTLSEYCLPYTNVGGVFVSYKSGEVDEEAGKSEKAVKLLGGEIESITKFQLPGTEIGRSFVKIKKVYKSGEVDEEAGKSEKAVKLLGGEIESITKFQLPGTEIGRSFVKIKKVENTKKKYPRKAGLPAKEPLS